MNTVVIACRTIENELLAVMKEQNCSYPVLWLESGLHNWPQKLNEEIQRLLDECRDYDTVLLGMSFCGNALVGLRTHDFQLIVPRCDDCITLLLGSLDRRREIRATYYLTEGWLKGERNLWVEYRDCLEKYGEKRGKRVFSTMLAHYENLALLDTGCFDRAQLQPEVQRIAAELNLNYTELEGTLDYLRALLQSQWDSRKFLRVPPQSVVSDKDCRLEGDCYGL